MSLIKISIVIPTHDDIEYLPAALDSIEQQTFSNYEVIVVDDGSTKYIREIETICRSKNINYIRQSNQGPSSARNTGINFAQGDYLVFLDADDLFLPNKLRLQSEFLDTHPEVGVVYSDGYLVNFGTNTEAQILFSEAGFLDKSLASSVNPLYKLIIHNCFPIHSAMLRRRCLDLAGNFDESIPAFEDWDFWIRLACFFRFAYLNQTVAKYRISFSNSSRNKERMRTGYEMVRQKIVELDIFDTLTPEIRAEALYQWAMCALYREDPKEANRRFRQALKHLPNHNHSFFGLILTQTLGRKAIHLYRLKQAIFGIRTQKKDGFTWSSAQ